MVHTLLNFLKRNLGKTFLGASLLASSFVQAQVPPNLGAQAGNYDYLGYWQDLNGNYHYYFISKAAALWPDANTAASALVGGTGYLATLTSAAENTRVFNLYAAYLATHGGQPTFAQSYDDDRNPWIGLTDFGAEGVFTWSNGENCNDFRNWDCGYRPNPIAGQPPIQVCEPNNVPIPGRPPGANNDEDFVQLLMFTPAGGDPAPGYLGEYGKKNAGKWNDWFDDRSQYYLVEFGPSTCVGDEGCSLGYWKTHAEDWQGFSTGQLLDNDDPMTRVFNVPDALGLDDYTLMQALSFPGGPGVVGGARNLLRQAVAALLNAASSGVDYPLSVIQVKNQVNAALASMNRATMLTLANTLDQYNNYHGATLCPGERTTTSRMGNPATLSADLQSGFAISGYPNPSKSNFNIRIDGSATEKVSVRVTDMTGRLIEQRTNIPANQTLQIGSNYRAGMYYIEVTQGEAKKQLKVVKQ